MTTIQTMIDNLKHQRSAGKLNLKEYVDSLLLLPTQDIEEDSIVSAEAVKAVIAICIERIMLRLIKTNPNATKSEAVHEVMAALCTISDASVIPVQGTLRQFIPDENFRKAYSIEFIALTALSAAQKLDVADASASLIAAIQEHFKQAVTA